MGSKAVSGGFKACLGLLKEVSVVLGCFRRSFMRFQKCLSPFKGFLSSQEVTRIFQKQEQFFVNSH